MKPDRLIAAALLFLLMACGDTRGSPRRGTPQLRPEPDAPTITDNEPPVDRMTSHWTITSNVYQDGTCSPDETIRCEGFKLEEEGDTAIFLSIDGDEDDAVHFCDDVSITSLDGEEMDLHCWGVYDVFPNGPEADDFIMIDSIVVGTYTSADEMDLTITHEKECWGGQICQGYPCAFYHSLKAKRDN